MSKTFTTTEVAGHKDADKGMYIIVDEAVYDVTGKQVLFPQHEYP